MTTETTDEPSTPRIRAVIVDDSPDVRYLLTTILEVDGRFEVVGDAHTADDGLEVVAQADPDLVLVDLQMEGHDGTWLIGELRRRGNDAALAVVTGTSLELVPGDVLDAGADSVHHKMTMTSTMADDLVDAVVRRRRTVSV